MRFLVYNVETYKPVAQADSFAVAVAVRDMLNDPANQPAEPQEQAWYQVGETQ